MIERWFGPTSEAQPQAATFWQQRGLAIGAGSLFVLLGTIFIALPTLLEAQERFTLEAGNVANRDVVAPYSLTFTSPLLTQDAQAVAIAQVQPIYDPNPDVTRQQIQLARDITAYVRAVRHDPYADLDQQVEDLLLIESITLGEGTWIAALNTPEIRWELMSNEVVALVELTMQRNVRQDQLQAIRGGLLNSVASRFSNEEADIIVAISKDLIQPNSFYNQPATETQQQTAAQTVPTQQRTFEQGQLIVRSGNLITERDMEAVRQFGLVQGANLQVQKLAGAFLAMLLSTFILVAYLDRFYPYVLRNPRLLILVATLFLIFLASINLFGEVGANQPYLYPAAALGLLITNLFSPQLAIFVSAVLAVLASLAFPSDKALEIATYTMIGNLAGILSMRRIERLNSFFVAGAVIGLTNLVVMLSFAMTQEDIPSLGQLVGRGIITAADGLFAAGIALVGLYIITSLTNLTTSLKLIELTDSKHVLLQQLLREAPGTYQHSLQVANLSELAAEAIGADAQLVRVAAMYHDIGKTVNPFFFGENTPPGINPHQELGDPFKSAKIIIGHVTDGDKIARQFKLPERIRDFILEHHGTTQVLYFYNQAIDRAEGQKELVDKAWFTYPGPAPRSRETAIMMLADGCESATRSIQPTSRDDVEKMVNTIFELRLSEGQLDTSGLTLNDLKVIRKTFIETLQAMYHPRIAYQMRHSATAEVNSEKRLASGFVKHLERDRAITQSQKLDTTTQKKIKAAIDGSISAALPIRKSSPAATIRSTSELPAAQIPPASDAKPPNEPL